MKPLKRIRINSDTNLYAINAIVVPVAYFYIEVMLDNGKLIKVPVKANEHVTPEDRQRGVFYRTLIPVLACHPISDTEFIFEVGETEVNSRYFHLNAGKHSSLAYLAYMGELPDVAESAVQDRRYVTPIQVYTVPAEEGMSEYRKRNPLYGATMRTDYLRTSILDKIDDETWEQLRDIKVGGVSWKNFLDSATNGRYTIQEDFSNCLIDIDAEYIPNAVIKRMMHMRFEKRMRG